MIQKNKLVTFTKVVLINFLLMYCSYTFAEPLERSKEFLTLYPGVLSEKEISPVKQYYEDNKTLNERGPIDVKALISGELPEDTPGVGPVIKVTREWLIYNNTKYDPENKLLNDSEYARALGYKDIIAYPTFGGHDDTFMFPYPGKARDKLLVSDLNHSLTNYLPVYPGDTLYLVANTRHAVDITPPEGSTYRSIAIETKGSIYNQHGKKVTDVVFRVTEGLRVYKDQSRAIENPTFADMWESPNWLSREAHKYTDEDWDSIKKLWKNEKRQGSESLYYEDVSIGDMPTWTVDGPMETSVLPIAPWGMGASGSRTLKKEILYEPDSVKLILGDDGIYRTKNKQIQIPPYPEKGSLLTEEQQIKKDAEINTADIHSDKKTRSPLVNYMGRDYAIRHLNNWMGDHGWLFNIRWSIMDPRGLKQMGKAVPDNPKAKRYLALVPFMQDKFVNAHGLTKDLAIVKSYVYNKFIDNGDYFVELVWWVETIEGDIWEEGAATIKLPSKNK